MDLDMLEVHLMVTFGYIMLVLVLSVLVFGWCWLVYTDL